MGATVTGVAASDAAAGTTAADADAGAAAAAAAIPKVNPCDGWTYCAAVFLAVPPLGS